MPAKNSSRPASTQGGHRNTNQDQATTLDQALAYAARGWIPVPSDGKRPLVKIENRTKVPTEAQIRKWWTTWPEAGVAILTGARSGLVVVDLDGDQGEANWAKLEAEHGPFPATYEVSTEHGRHLYFTDPNGEILTRRSEYFLMDGEPVWGVDVRGEGGLVIAPPHPDREVIQDLDLAALPAGLVGPMSTSTAKRNDVPPAEAEKWQTDGDPDQDVTDALATYDPEHPRSSTRRLQVVLLGLGQDGHPGTRKALETLQGRFLADDGDAHDWSRMLAGAPGQVTVTRTIGDDDGPSLDELLDGYQPKAQDKPKESAKEQAIAKELTRLIAQHEARRRFEAMKAGQLPDPALTRLSDLLAEPITAPVYRVDRLWTSGGNIVLAAQRKAGKTTLTGNLIRSLVDGDAFLGEPGPAHVNGFEVTPVDGMVAILDMELDRDMLHRWLADQGIAGTDRVMVESLRGQVHLFDVMDDKRRQKWAALLAHHGVKVLILDPLGALLDAYGRDENSNSDVGPVLQALDALKAEAGISEMLITHHMGHQGERSRGASKLRGWPDAEWFLVRERAANGEEPPPDAARFFLAEGRDVMVPESQVRYDPVTRHLTVAGGNRVQHRATKDGPVLLEIIEQTPGLSQSAIVDAAMGRGIAKHPATSALHKLIGDGLVLVEKGSNNAKIHSPAPASVPVSRSFPAVSRETDGEVSRFPGSVRSGTPEPPASSTDGDQDQRPAGTLDPFAMDHSEA